MAPNITKELLEDIFKEPVSSFEVRAGCNEGENVGGIVKTIIVKTKSGQIITAFFKTFPDKENPHYRRVKESQIFRTEADVYSKLDPAVQNLIYASIGAHHSLPLPKLHAFFNNDEDDYLCLEDIRPAGYKMPNVFNGLTYPECSLAIQELARFHAFTHALIQAQGEKIFSPKDPRGYLHRFFSRFDGPDIQMWFNLLENSVRVAVDVLEVVEPALANTLNTVIPAGIAAETWKTIVDRTDATMFPCIVHGDFWSNNFLIKYDSNGQPEDVKFIDFQNTRRGNIFEDLMYFLFTSTSPEFRQKHLQRLLDDYYTAFTSALEWIQCPVPPYFSHGYLLNHFNRLTRPALVHMCFAIPLQLGNPSKVYAQLKEAEGSNAEEAQNQEQQFDPDLEAKKFANNLRAMYAHSEFARKRLEDIVREVLVS